MPPERIDRLPPQERKELPVRVGYVFPGQASQVVTMGLEFFQSSPAAKRAFEEANETLGFDLSEIIFKGPKETLENTINAQPALLTVSFAAHEALKERLGDETPTPELVAGHSVGTLAALVVAKVLTFRDGVKVARERGRLMEQASKEHPGGMAAILELDELALDHICAETGVEIANFNSDDQVVISGDRERIAMAMDLALQRGARNAIRLPVSAAFHSRHMRRAKIGFQDVIAGVSFAEPQVPIIANSSAEILTDRDKIKEELINGVCMPVRWKQSVKVMTKSGITLVYEFGPGRVLTNLAKGIPNLNAIAINSLKSLNEFAS